VSGELVAQSAWRIRRRQGYGGTGSENLIIRRRLKTSAFACPPAVGRLWRTGWRDRQDFQHASAFAPQLQRDRQDK